jgi:oligoendopeptidase F
VRTSFVEKCNISSKEIKEGEQNTKVENEHMLTNSVCTFEILERIEKNQDEMIIKLKSDLQNERDKKEDLKEISGKIDEIKSAISTTCISMKSETCNSISEGYEKISTKTTNQIKDFTEKFNRNITETISQTLQSKIVPLIDNMRKISGNSVSVTKSLETTGAVLSHNTVTNREITKTLQNLAKLN